MEDDEKLAKLLVIKWSSFDTTVSRCFVQYASFAESREEQGRSKKSYL